MVYNGRVNGNRIEFDERLPLPDWARVRVEVQPEAPPRKGSPAALLTLAGTLSDEEAEAILKAAQLCRQV